MIETPDVMNSALAVKRFQNEQRLNASQTATSNALAGTYGVQHRLGEQQLAQNELLNPIGVSTAKAEAREAAARATVAEREAAIAGSEAGQWTRWIKEVGPLLLPFVGGGLLGRMASRRAVGAATARQVAKGAARTWQDPITKEMITKAEFMRRAAKAGVFEPKRKQ